MTDEQSSEKTETPPPISAPEKDWVLLRLVDLVNVSEQAEINITLHVGGTLVSGLLVGGKAWFDAFGKDMAKHWAGDEELAQTFSRMGALYYDQPETARPAPSYLHLKNACFVSSGDSRIPSRGGIWWRGRISEVAGFTIGVLGFNEG